jgi:hypothetical protein
MQGVELSTSACNGHAVVALCGDLDITGAADAGRRWQPWWYRIAA